jgi:gas vesicle protein
MLSGFTTMRNRNWTSEPINDVVQHNQEKIMGRIGWRRDRSALRGLGMLFVGIGIGTAVALLLAPATGEDLRHALDRRYRKTVKRIGRHREDIGDRAEDLLDRVYDLRERGSKILDLGRGGSGRRRWA